MPARSWSGKLKPFFVSVAVLVVILVVGRSLLSFKINKVICRTQYGNSCPEDVTNFLQTLGGTPIIYIGNRVVGDLKKQNTQIQSIKVRKIFPDTVQTTVYLAKPTVALTAIDSNQSAAWYLVDDNFQLVGQSSNPVDLPKLVLGYDHWVFSGHKLTDEVAAKSIPFVVLLNRNFPPVSASISKTDDLTTTISGINVIFSAQKDPAISVATLQLALRDPTIQKNPPKSIDLRFVNPVLAY